MEIIHKGPQLPQKYPDLILWHYTSSEVFWKMLSGEFYATHYRYLNDSAEIIYGINVSEECLTKAKYHLPYADGIINYIRKKDFFLFCFSEVKDSLYQWRAYTPHGGFSIGFSYNELAVRLSQYECRNKNETYFDFNFLKCKYINYQTIKRYIELCSYNLEKARDIDICPQCGLTLLASEIKADKNQNIRFDGNFEKYANLNAYEIMEANKKYQADVFNAYVLLMSLQQRCASFKHPSFHFEKEHRLTISGDNLRKHIEIIGEKPRIKIKLSDLQKCIKEVYISPHGDIEQNILLAEIAREKFNLDFEIYKSKSSFNGK